MELLVILGLIAAWVVITIAMEYESGFSATVAVLTTAGLLQYFTEFKPFSMIWENPWATVILFGMYIVAGVVWSGVKWFSFVYQIRDKFNAYVDEHKAGGYSNPENWAKHKFNFDVPLKVKQHKARIVRWMTYWPMSLAWTIVDDPVRRAFDWFYRNIAQFFQNVSDKAFDVKN